MNKNRKIAKEFKELILKGAKIKEGTQADNIKLGNMGSWAELFGNVEWNIPELGMTCTGTCGNHCKGCFDPENPRKSPCYVAKSYYQHTNRNDDGTVGDIITNKCTVKLGHAYRTLAMRLYRKELMLKLDAQLTNKKKKFKIIRINESGELESVNDLRFWNELARRHPETIFYLYTKNYKAVSTLLSKEILNENLFVNISVWHKQGINKYLELCESSEQIRAFVLVDKKWTVEKYFSKGLNVTSMCPAYDEDGTMDHGITCDKCGKCFRKNNKVVGCYEH